MDEPVAGGLTVKELARAYLWQRERGATPEEAVTIVGAYPEVDPRRPESAELLGGLREARGG